MCVSHAWTERRGGSFIIDRTRRLGLVASLTASLLVTTVPAVGVVGSGAASCLSKAGPVGDTFLDCSGSQVFNLVPPGQAGTYNLADFLKAQAGQGFPPHTRDQERRPCPWVNRPTFQQVVQFPAKRGP